MITTDFITAKRDEPGLAEPTDVGEGPPPGGHR